MSLVIVKVQNSRPTRKKKKKSSLGRTRQVASVNEGGSTAVYVFLLQMSFGELGDVNIEADQLGREIINID